MTTTEETPITVSPHDRFTDWTLGKLGDELNPNRIAEDRQGNPYLEGWDVIAAANHYFGFDGWSSTVLEVTATARTQGERGRDNDRHLADLYTYLARVAVTAGGVTHTDVGTSPTATDTAEAHETAIKASVTDGIKRALRHFGSQFGNDLYDKGRTGGGYAEPIPERQVEPAFNPDQGEHFTDAESRNADIFLTTATTKFRIEADDVYRGLRVANREELILRSRTVSWADMAAALKVVIESTPL